MKAKIDYPLLKKNLIVELSKKDILTLENILEDIVQLKKKENPPPLFEVKKICKKCAYHDLCFI